MGDPRAAENPNPNCPECHGTGLYVGMFVIEACRTCSSRGRADAGAGEKDAQAKTRVVPSKPVSGVLRWVHCTDFRDPNAVVQVIDCTSSVPDHDDPSQPNDFIPTHMETVTCVPNDVAMQSSFIQHAKIIAAWAEMIGALISEDAVCGRFPQRDTQTPAKWLETHALWSLGMI